MIRNVPEPISLFVTVPESAAPLSAITRDFPHAQVRPFPNRGRDVAPFIALLPELQAYDLVCKIHAKREDYWARAWRIEMLRGLLGGPTLTSLIVNVFDASPDLMMASTASLYVDGPLHEYTTGATLRSLHPDLPAAYGFFAGTMFWTRPSIFADFADTFPMGRFDDPIIGKEQLEHAVERLFCIRVSDKGGAIGLTRIADGVPEIELIPAAAPRLRNLTELVEHLIPSRYAAYPEDWYTKENLVSKYPLGTPFG